MHLGSLTGRPLEPVSSIHPHPNPILIPLTCYCSLAQLIFAYSSNLLFLPCIAGCHSSASSLHPSARCHAIPNPNRIRSLCTASFRPVHRWNKSHRIASEAALRPIAIVTDEPAQPITTTTAAESLVLLNCTRFPFFEPSNMRSDILDASCADFPHLRRDRTTPLQH